MKLFKEVQVKTISNIETQSVNTELVEPVCDTVFKVLFNIAVVEIELHKLKMTFPAFIPEVVVIR